MPHTRLEAAATRRATGRKKRKEKELWLPLRQTSPAQKMPSSALSRCQCQDSCQGPTPLRRPGLCGRRKEHNPQRLSTEREKAAGLVNRSFHCTVVGTPKEHRPKHFSREEPREIHLYAKHNVANGVRQTLKKLFHHFILPARRQRRTIGRKVSTCTTEIK